MEGTTNFSSMPHELQLDIFSRLFESSEKLNKKEIANCSQVCKEWHNLFEDEFFWPEKPALQFLALSKNLSPREKFHKITQIYTNLVIGSFIKTDLEKNNSSSLHDLFKKISALCKDSQFFKISGENIITTSNKGEVLIWNVITKIPQVIKVGKNIDHLDVKENTLVTSSDQVVKIWDLNTLQEKRCFPPTTEPKKHYVTKKKLKVSYVHIHDKDNIFVGYDSEQIFHLQGENKEQKIYPFRKMRNNVIFIHTLVINGALHLFSQTERQVRHRNLNEERGQVSSDEMNNLEFTHTVAAADIIFRAYNDGTIKIMGGPNELDEPIHKFNRGESVESMQFVDGKLYIRSSKQALILFDFSEKLKPLKEIELGSIKTINEELQNNSPHAKKAIKEYMHITGLRL